MTAALRKPTVDLSPLRQLLSGGHWWLLRDITSALGVSRTRAAARVQRAIAEGWVEKSSNGIRLRRAAQPPILRGERMHGAPRGSDGRVVAVSVGAEPLRYSERVARPGRRAWWPGVSERCADCGGNLWLRPAEGGHVPAALACLLCGRESREVRP